MNEEYSKFSLPWILCCVMALGSPIALVGIIIMAINTGKEFHQVSDKNTDTVACHKLDTKIREEGITNIRINEGTDSRIQKGKEQYVEQSIAETVRSRRHLGIFQFSRKAFRTGKEVVEVV